MQVPPLNLKLGNYFLLVYSIVQSLSDPKTFLTRPVLGHRRANGSISCNQKYSSVAQFQLNPEKSRVIFRTASQQKCGRTAVYLLKNTSCSRMITLRYTRLLGHHVTAEISRNLAALSLSLCRKHRIQVSLDIFKKNGYK